MTGDEKLKKLQRTQMMILKDVAEICKKNNLRYYMIGGTLLGAVRHKGFIPWDDDMDIVMFRKEYNKLFEIIKTNYSEKYFVQRFESDSNYTRYIMKIRLNGTKHVEAGVSDVEMHQGIYIDIFPVDYLKNAGIITHIRGGMVRVLFAYKNIRHRHNHYTGIKRIIAEPMYLLTKIIPEKFVNRLFEIVYECDNNKNCKFVTNFASRYKWKKQMFPIEYYNKGIPLTFEDTTFIAPKKYKRILKRLYGNYMALPPEEKRIAHDIIEIDFGQY